MNINEWEDKKGEAELDERTTSCPEKGNLQWIFNHKTTLPRWLRRESRRTNCMDVYMRKRWNLQPKSVNARISKQNWDETQRTQYSTQHDNGISECQGEKVDLRSRWSRFATEDVPGRCRWLCCLGGQEKAPQVKLI